MLYHIILASMQKCGQICVGLWGTLNRVSCADSDDEEFWVLAAPLLTTGSVTQAPPNLTNYSIDLSELMTKPETIIESPGAESWDWEICETASWKV